MHCGVSTRCSKVDCWSVVRVAGRFMLCNKSSLGDRYDLRPCLAQVIETQGFLDKDAVVEQSWRCLRCL